MAKTAPKVSAAAEQQQMAWALTRADLKALALRIEAVTNVGSENNLHIVNQVVQDMKNSLATTAKNIAEWSKPAEPEAGA